MSEEKTKTLRELEEETLKAMVSKVKPDNPLKQMFVEYVGNKYDPDDGEVTIDLCLRALAEEFPEFLAPVAEQNFMLGYYQCEKDIATIVAMQNSEDSSNEEPEDVEFELVEEKKTNV